MATNSNRKYWIAAGISIVSILGAAAYLQYKRLMDYCMSFKSIKVNRIGFQNLNIDIWLNFKNKSNVTFTLVSQSYKVYLNNIFVTKLSNTSSNVIKSKETSDIGLNVDINPSKVFKQMGFGMLDMVKNYKNIQIKIDMKMKVKIWGMTFTIPYVYEDSLQGMMGTSPENKSDDNKESEC